MYIPSEFVEVVRNFFPVPSDQCFTGNAVSTEDTLRDASVGTSERQARLVFDPYPQVRQTICTLELLQPSKELSLPFSLLRDRSLGF